MLYNTLHNRGLRLLAAIVGELIAAAALNLFIAPLHLYTSGLMGLCQVLRTLMQQYLGLSFGTTDIAGILYFIVNIPIMVLAYKALGREFTGKTVICIVAYSFFYSIIPVPSTPFIDDYLTACLLSGCKNFSAARAVDAHHVEAIDWGAVFAVAKEVPKDVKYVGIRAHYLHPADGGEENIVSCRVDRIVKDVFSTILMLQTPGGGSLRMELDKGAAFTAGSTLDVHVSPDNVMLLMD